MGGHFEPDSSLHKVYVLPYILICQIICAVIWNVGSRLVVVCWFALWICRGGIPENTIEGFRESKSKGAVAVEASSCLHGDYGGVTVHCSTFVGGYEFDQRQSCCATSWSNSGPDQQWKWPCFWHDTGRVERVGCWCQVQVSECICMTTPFSMALFSTNSTVCWE